MEEGEWKEKAKGVIEGVKAEMERGVQERAERLMRLGGLDVGEYYKAWRG